jgi:hypothetical protein
LAKASHKVSPCSREIVFTSQWRAKEIAKDMDRGKSEEVEPLLKPFHCTALLSGARYIYT